MKVSVVIPCMITNDKIFAIAAKCIKLARQKTTVPFELIIVETVSNYFSTYSDVYIQEKNKTTVTKSINKGLKIATGDYTVLLTNDVFVEDGWLEALLDCFTKYKDCGAATLASTQFFHLKLNLIEEWGIWGSLFMMPTKLLKELDYLDERYQGSWDDTDLWMRLALKGYKIYRNHNVVVEHLIRQTHGSDPIHMSNYYENEKLFKDKFKNHRLDTIYKVLVEGVVI